MPGFEIKHSVSIWNKELKVDFKSLFKNLTKGVVHGVGGKWDDVAIDLSEVVTSLGLQKDKAAELAWLLIWRARTYGKPDSRVPIWRERKTFLSPKTRSMTNR